MTMTTTSKAKSVPVKLSTYSKMENKSVDTLIADAIKAAGSAKVKIQQAAVAILLHAYKHNDWRKANDLVEGLGNGVRRDSLVEWFKTYGGLAVDEQSKKFCDWKGPDHIKANIANAKEKDWAECKKENVWGGFDLKDSLAKVRKSAMAALAKVDKAREQGKPEEEIAHLLEQVKVTREQIIAMDAMIAAL